MGRSSRRKLRVKVRREFRVFLSHATADKWIATTICQRLEKLGVRTFRDDRDIKGGDDIPDSIRREIARCDELVVLLTPQSVGRVWVILEIGMALGRNRRIVPILYHVGLDPVPAMIRSKKVFELNDIERYISEVSERSSKR